MTDLRSANTMIKLVDAVDEDKGEMAAKLEQCLTDLEVHLITEAQKSFPQDRVDEWLQRLNQATCDESVSVQQMEEETRFISGVPRDQKWMRIETIASLPLKKLKALADETDFHINLPKMIT